MKIFFLFLISTTNLYANTIKPVLSCDVGTYGIKNISVLEINETNSEMVELKIKFDSGTIETRLINSKKIVNMENMEEELFIAYDSRHVISLAKEIDRYLIKKSGDNNNDNHFKLVNCRI